MNSLEETIKSQVRRINLVRVQETQSQGQKTTIRNLRRFKKYLVKKKRKKILKVIERRLMEAKKRF